MKALVLYGPKDLRLEDLDEPSVKPDWVKIRAKRVGICGTDKAFYKGTYKPGKLPIIPGHEIAGEIVEVGDNVSGKLIGRRVTTEINVFCGRCWYCLHGMPTHCPYRETIGITIDGGMAEYMITRSDLIHFIDELNWVQGAFVEPLAAVIEMIKMHPPQPLSNIAIMGSGTIGLLALQVVKMYSPTTVVVITRRNSPKACVAKKLGADEVISVDEVNEFIKRETPEGQGFDYVVEATGNPTALDKAVEIVRPRGVIAAKSTHGALTTFNYTLLVVKEAKIVGSRCGPFEDAIKLLKKNLIDVESLVTAVYPLSQGVKAFEESFNRRHIKIHLTI